MPSVAFRRAHRLLSNRPAAVAGARFLAVVEALLCLALLGVGALLVALVLSRGRTQAPAARLVAVPTWLRGAIPYGAQAQGLTVHFADTGLYPLVAANQFPPSPWAHRVAARGLLSTMRAVPPLRRNLSALALLLALGLALLLALALVNRARRGLVADAASRVAAALRHQVHRQMYRRGQSSLPSEGTSPVVALFRHEVDDVRDGVAAVLDRSWRLPTLAAGLLLLALLVSWKFTVFLFSLGALVWLVSRPMDRRARREADRASRDAATQLALLQEDLGMLRTVRVFGMEAVDKARFDEHLERHRAAEVRRLLTEDRRSPTTQLLIGAAAIVSIGLLAFGVLEGQLAPAAALIVCAALLGLGRPLARWLDLGRIVRRADRSAQTVFHYLEARPELQQAVKAQFLAPLKDQIRFENVSLNDPSGRPIVEDVSAEIPARTRTAILSLDEAPKHALACLVPRLIDPTRGRVVMDGVDIRDVTLESLRAQVAIVLQDDLVFSDTVRANIGLGDTSYTLPRIIEAAKIAHAHHFVQDLPHGYDTVIGPLGHHLSPDQQYRIALARAFLHDPSIVLIEEPTVALDEDIKHLIDDTIDRLAPGRTLIFLPHRLSTIRRCHQVIVLHNGRVEATGNPRDVYGQSKLYRHIQYVEFNQYATGEVEAGQMSG